MIVKYARWFVPKSDLGVLKLIELGCWGERGRGQTHNRYGLLIDDRFQTVGVQAEYLGVQTRCQRSAKNMHVSRIDIELAWN